MPHIIYSFCLRTVTSYGWKLYFVTQFVMNSNINIKICIFQFQLETVVWKSFNKSLKFKGYVTLLTLIKLLLQSHIVSLTN